MATADTGLRVVALADCWINQSIPGRVVLEGLTAGSDQSLAKLGHYSRNKHFVLFEPSIRYRSHIHRGTTSYLAYQCLGLGSGFWGDLQEDKQLTVADCGSCHR